MLEVKLAAEYPPTAPDVQDSSVFVYASQLLLAEDAPGEGTV